MRTIERRRDRRGRRGRLTAGILACFVSFGPARGAVAQTTDVGIDPAPTLASLQREALEADPGLEAAVRRWQSFVEQAAGEGKLPDPRLTYGYFVQPVETRVGPQRHQLGLTQTLPWFGSLDRRERAGRHGAEVQRARVEEMALRVELEVAEAYHEIQRIDRSAEIAVETLDLLAAFEPIAQARLRFGRADNADLLRLQIELGRAQDRVRHFEDRRPAAVARLNALLARPIDRPLPTTGAIESPATLAPTDSLLAWLRARQPRLRALEAEAAREETMTEIARDAGRPDLTIGVAHTFVGGRDDVDMPDEGTDATLATVSVNLPLWRGSIDARVRASQSRRAAALAERRDAEFDLAAALRDAKFAYDDAQRRIELYRATLVPKAEETLQALLANYQNDRADFLDLLEAQRTLLDFQLVEIEAEVARAVARARIDRLVGRHAVELSTIVPALAASEDQR